MTKADFVEVLKREGFGGASLTAGMVTVDLIDPTKKEMYDTFQKVKLLANRYDYNHSFRVCKLNEVRKREEET